MADALGTAFSVGNGFSSSGDSPMTLLLAAYKRAQQAPVTALKDNQTKLEKRQVFFNGLRSKVEALKGYSDNFLKDDAAAKFSTRKTTASDPTVFTATASGTANIGVGAIKVERLASNDILISDRKTLADGFGITAGTKNFDINVNGVAKTVAVIFDGTETNESALQKISTAVNGTTDIGVSAAFIKDTSTTGRLTFTSKTSGTGNSISFTDTDSVLNQIGITPALTSDTANRTLSTSTGAGFKKAAISTLNAKLDVNGVEVLRGTNTIDDVLTGVTLNLLKPQLVADEPVTLTTSADIDKLTSNLKPTLDAFNDLLKFVKQEVGGSVKKDSVIRGLYSKLRGISGQRITSADPGNPDYITGIGLKIGSDGTLSIGDKTVLEDLLKSDPAKISAIFTSSDGFAKKVNDAVTGLLGEGGLISARTTSLRNQITATSKRTKDLEAKIDRQAEGVRKEYATLQRLFVQTQNQGSIVNSFSRFY